MGTITYRDGVSIGLVILYLPALAVAILLSIRHGFGKASGWRFMIIFALARILGACLQLATINSPTNISLYIGADVLLNVAVSPLELTTLGLLIRITNNINKHYHTIIQTWQINIIQLVNLVGIILTIVGGVDAGNDYSKNHSYVPQPLAKAGLALFLVSFAYSLFAAIILSFSISHAEAGEKRVLLAIALSLPFLLTRLIYSSIANYANPKSFNLLTGNVTILLCMALIEELVIVALYLGTGFTLKKVEKPARVQREQGSSDQPIPQGKPSVMSRIGDFLGRYTLVGRLITRNKMRREADVEMQSRLKGESHA